VKVRPDLRDTGDNWFYWYFRVTGASARTIRFEFPGSFISSFGPAVSTDGGKIWQWLYYTPNPDGSSFEYSFNKNEKEVRFSMCVPYLHSDFKDFFAPYRDHPFVSTGSLSLSRKGRKIERILIKDPGITQKYRILLTARHHSCEAMASYALEGIIESVLTGEEESMLWLRENAAFYIVPFMDIDGVEDGDQGKNRKPWDHLADYAAESIYKSTGALREQFPEWAGSDPVMALDLHCPGLRGKWGETIYIVEAADRVVAAEQRKFLDDLKKVNTGELKLHPEKSLIEYGTAWNKSSGGGKNLGFREWVSRMDHSLVAATLEIAYSNNNGQKVTPDNARLLGKDLANAIARYLRRPEH
jgi:hypothetical protein